MKLLIDGKALRAVRRAKDISQTKAATDIGVDQSTISNIERNAGRVAEDTIRRYAAYLGVNLPRSNGNGGKKAA